MVFAPSTAFYFIALFVFGRCFVLFNLDHGATNMQLSLRNGNLDPVRIEDVVDGEVDRADEIEE